MMLELPASVREYYVYKYEHIDDLSFIRKPQDVDPMVWLADQADIEELFRSHGWEGDGDLGILWLPPFVAVGDEDTWGTYVWFVKQSNNGTAFIASKHELGFQRLYQQNLDRPIWRGMHPQGLARASRDSLEKCLDTILPELEADLAAVRFLPSDSKVANHLIERAQGRMTQTLMSLLDDCYLQLLIEVMQHGNRSNLKLRKSKASLNPADYLPDDVEGDFGGFFTLSGLISDLWVSYKFEPFQAKLDMLLKPIELRPPENLMFEVRKHVMLRNAIQHNEGWIEQKLLDDLGRSFVPVMTATGLGQLRLGTTIAFQVEEIRVFDEALRAIGRLLDERMEERIVTKVYHRRQR